MLSKKAKGIMEGAYEITRYLERKWFGTYQSRDNVI
jgi:hypothetical protein